jgi:hypothetical protein
MKNTKRFNFLMSWLSGQDIKDPLGKLEDKPSSERSYWDLDDIDRKIFTWHTDKERSKRGYPTSGRSETIMRNRVNRHKEIFGTDRDNVYDTYKGRGR